MNEIVIDDKKYISSKQAAELTGYAKDYVGQLCREGRVPARLIGRSWYVLASAIQDHKFGTEEVKKAPLSTAPQTIKESVLAQTWEAPRYKQETESHFPSINKLSAPRPQAPERGPEEEKTDELGTMQVMHDAWKDWFSGIKQQESKAAVESAEPAMEIREESKELFIETAEVQIPIHAVERAEIAPIKRYGESEIPQEMVQKETSGSNPPKKGKKRSNRLLKALFLLTALSSVFLGVIGLGFADKIISSQIYLYQLAGITVIKDK
ncbi:MAG TPA: helix-turn-helix domain-containing protein [Candidatus Paceibacterota bacterium]|nr:helix-turn-helix domain-containing protein [Candidatus Paceibacterota bacterium]